MSRKKPLILVVVGNGFVPASVIETGISDAVDAGAVAEIAIAWYSKESANLTVYEWLENHTDFPMYIYADGVVPKSVAVLAEEVVQTDHIHVDILSDSFERAKELKADLRVLLLWDDNDPETMEDIVFRSDAAGFKVLDLSNGLVPIMVEEDDAPAPQTVVEDEPVKLPVEDETAWEPYDDEEEVERPKPVIDESEPFTSQELTNMPLASLKRMVLAQGKDLPTKPTKAALIEVLLETGTTVAVASEALTVDAEEEYPAVSTTSEMERTHHEHQTAVAIPTMVVVQSDGSTMTFVLNDKMRQVIAKLVLESLAP